MCLHTLYRVAQKMLDTGTIMHTKYGATFTPLCIQDESIFHGITSGTDSDDQY